MQNGGPTRESIITKLIACGLLGAMGFLFLFMAALPLLDAGGGRSGQQARAKVTVTSRVVDATIFGTLSFFFFATMVSVARAKKRISTPPREFKE